MSEIDEISSEFLQESIKAVDDAMMKAYELSQTRPNRKGGPWPAFERMKRMNEVARLHLDYGFSARKISELLKIPRNTINHDLDVFYNTAFKSLSVVDPTEQIFRTLLRLDVQRTRLREQLDKTQSLQDKLAVENLILSIDSKSIAIYQRVIESTHRIYNDTTKRLNKYLDKEDSENRYVTLFENIRVSAKTREKINALIREDRKVRGLDTIDE